MGDTGTSGVSFLGSGMRICFMLLAAAGILAGCGRNDSADTAKPDTHRIERTAPVHKVRVAAEYPHDAKAFTQGLVFSSGRLYEGTGRYGQSGVRLVEIKTGRVLRNCSMPPGCFGEGITVLGGKLFQLTWKKETAFVYDPDSFEVLRSLTYKGEGWGLTDDGKQLVMSNGTSSLMFLDPLDFTVRSSVFVRDGRNSVTFLNELEYINGEIWANVLNSNRIARIDPLTGSVTAWVDLSGVLEGYGTSANPLNGIAYDDTSGRIFVTGKLWPKMFQIEVVR